MKSQKRFQKRGYPTDTLFLVPLTGLEPVQYRYRGILSFQFYSEMLVF